MPVCRGCSVSSFNKLSSIALAGALAAVLVVPTLAEAQRRGPARRPVPVVRSVIYVGPYAYPRYYYDGWYQWGYPFPPYGYRYGWLNEFNASLRLQVTPREAQVFVDGYLAGKVDDFDGVFQRLRLRPGGHEITVFLDGYETVREAVYVEAGAERKLQFGLNRLRAGEQSEPPPQPAAERITDERTSTAPAPPMRTLPPVDHVNPGEPVEPSQSPARFGTLSIRVQPGDAEILIDGERWSAPSGQDRLSIQLSEGRHQIEVRREGMRTYVEDILIRRGATFTLNVSLR